MFSRSKLVVMAVILAATILSIRHLTFADTKEPHRSPATDAPAAAALSGPVMLELYTPYCPSCSQMAPLVEDLAKSCAAEGVSVVQYDISAAENEYLVEELRIEAVPTFLFFDGSGRETARLVGKQTADALHAGLADIGGARCGNRG